MEWTERPVIILGHGVRLAGAAALVPALLDLGIPVLTSWPAADLVDSDHLNYFGRPGVYGQRCANKVLANADLVVSIGCRLSIWTVGYDFPLSHQRVVCGDVNGLMQDILDIEPPDVAGWMLACKTWRTLHPWLESPHHDDANGYINPHRFMSVLQQHLRPDEVIVADCASGSLAAHQILRLRPPQRLMTSGGLGEMGCGLPAAIGASFARGKGEVICLHTDGAMMTLLGELQTIVHHQLPIKLVVFVNDGYAMIRDTQRNLGYRRVGVDAASGVSCPDFCGVAQSFGGIGTCNLTAGALVGDALNYMMAHNGPYLLQVRIDPEYVWGPKLRPGRNADGTIKNANFAEMSP